MNLSGSLYHFEKKTHLGYAVLMKFFQLEARFPSKPNDVPKAIVDFIAKQLKLPSQMLDQYSWNTQTSTRTK
jgi:hypothetical protein